MSIQSKQDTAQGIPPGTMVDGRYKVVRFIGQGGNGLVHEVEHALTGRRLAMKSLLDETGAARLEQEARATSLMRNAHAAKITDMGMNGPFGPYLVMELLDGQSLRSLLDDAGQLPLELTVNIALQVCECLAEAHAHGIIHRDLKPENVFLCSSAWQGQHDVRVLDFGVVKIASDGPIPNSSLTRTGSTVGTPYYMSLEQLRNSSAVDARADIYSLGVVLYESLSGRKPFQAETIGDLVFALCSGPPTHLHRIRPDLPQDIAEVVMRTLAMNRDQRPASMTELAAALIPHGNPAFGLWVKIDGKQPAAGRSIPIAPSHDAFAGSRTPTPNPNAAPAVAAVQAAATPAEKDAVPRPSPPSARKAIAVVPRTPKETLQMGVGTASSQGPAGTAVLNLQDKPASARPMPPRKHATVIGIGAAGVDAGPASSGATSQPATTRTTPKPGGVADQSPSSGPATSRIDDDPTEWNPDDVAKTEAAPTRREPAPGPQFGVPPAPASGGGRDTPTEMFQKGVHPGHPDDAPSSTGDRDTPTRAFNPPPDEQPPPVFEAIKTAAYPPGADPRDAIGMAPTLGMPMQQAMGAPMPPPLPPLEPVIPRAPMISSPLMANPALESARLAPDAAPRPGWKTSLDRALVRVGGSLEGIVQRVRAAPKGYQIGIIVSSSLLVLILLTLIIWVLARH